MSLSYWTLTPDGPKAADPVALCRDGAGFVVVAEEVPPELSPVLQLVLRTDGFAQRGGRVETFRSCQLQGGPPAFFVPFAALSASSAWRLEVRAGTKLFAEQRLLLEPPPPAADPPRPARVALGRVELVARAEGGARLPAQDAVAGDVEELELRGALDHDGEAPPPESEALSLLLEAPDGRSATLPVRVLRRRKRWGVEVRVTGPFADGDWTFSLLQAGHGVLRRVRLRLAPTPLRVRSSQLVRLDARGARPLGTVVAPEDARGRLVFSYELQGRASGPLEARLTLRDAAGATVACWRQALSEPPAEGPHTLLFPCQGARLPGDAPLEATLALGGVEAHRKQVLLRRRSAFRSDGTLLDAQAPVDEARQAEDLAFFGIEPRPRRKRRDPRLPRQAEA
jgi:hypothetical protein